MDRSLFQQVYKLWLLSLIERFGDFRVVANYAGVSASALTQSLKSLEEYYEKNLVLKKRGAPTLTQEGLEILNEYREIIQSLEDKANGNQGQQEIRKVTIGAYESLALDLGPILHEKLTQEFPGLKIEYVVDRSQKLAQYLRQGRLDFAMVVNIQGHDAFFSDHIYTNSFSLYCTPEVAREYKDPIHELGFATLSPNSDGHPYFISHFLNKLNIDKADVLYQSDSFEMIKALTNHGSVVGLLPSDVAKNSPRELKDIASRYLKSNVDSQHSICLLSRTNSSMNLKNFILNSLKKVTHHHK